MSSRWKNPVLVKKYLFDGAPRDVGRRDQLQHGQESRIHVRKTDLVRNAIAGDRSDGPGILDIERSANSVFNQAAAFGACTWRVDSQSPKKKSLSLLIGPPKAPPNWLKTFSGLRAVAEGLISAPRRCRVLQAMAASAWLLVPNAFANSARNWSMEMGGWPSNCSSKPSTLPPLPLT